MTVVAERARVRFIPRMPHRGDLVVLVDGDQVLLRAADVEHLAGLPPWSGGETLIDEHWIVIDDHEYYDHDTAIARAQAAGTPAATDFLTWLEPTLEQLLTDDVLTAATPTTSFLAAHSVRTAARLLSDTPGIDIGQQGLFHLMHELGWTTRTGADWEITPTAHRAGWLTTRTVPVPAATRTRSRPYPQIHVTADGIDQLRTALTFTPTTGTRALTALPPPLFT